MINEIKEIIQNYINNAKLCSLMTGIVVNHGIMINEKLTIPKELIKGNLINYTVTGDKVRIIRNHGGKEFYIVEIIDKAFITMGSTITLRQSENMNEYIVEDVKI